MADEFEEKAQRWMPYTADEVARLEAVLKGGERKGYEGATWQDDAMIQKRLIATLRVTQDKLREVEADLSVVRGDLSSVQGELAFKKRRVLVKALRKVLRDFDITVDEVRVW